VLAAQNSIEPGLIGVSTSSVTLFRSIGGSMGVAVFGAIFSYDLQHQLMARLPAGTILPRSLGSQGVHQLPAALREDYLLSFSQALHSVYLVAARVTMMGFILTRFLKNQPLRK